MIAGGVGLCVQCGLEQVGASRCVECGGLVVYDSADEVDPRAAGQVRWERCVVFGLRDEPVKACVLTIDDERIALADGRHIIISWATDDVEAVTVEDEAGVRSRVTATRLLFLGRDAFRQPKTTICSWLTVIADDTLVVVEIPSVPPAVVRTEISRMLGWDLTPVPAEAELPPPPSSPSAGAGWRPVEDRLRALAALHSDGLVSDEQFAAKRIELLGEL